MTTNKTSLNCKSFIHSLWIILSVCICRDKVELKMKICWIFDCVCRLTYDHWLEILHQFLSVCNYVKSSVVYCYSEWEGLPSQFHHRLKQKSERTHFCLFSFSPWSLCFFCLTASQFIPDGIELNLLSSHLLSTCINATWTILTISLNYYTP